MRILLIDDNPGIRQLIRYSLDETNCCVVVGETDTAESAVSAVGEYRPQLVIMDWAMPGEDGVWATRQLKVIYPDVEVVAFTTTDDRELAERFLAAGASAAFPKSELSELVAWVVKRAGHGSVPSYI